MQIDLRPYNEEGKKHGHWEIYHSCGELSLKGEYINGKRHGPWESYWWGGRLHFTGSYDMGKRIGYWIKGSEKVFYAN